MALITSNRMSASAQQPPLPKSAAEVPAYLKAQQALLQQAQSRLSNVINSLSMVGTAAEQPPAGQAGRFYFAADTIHLFIDNGTAWVQLV